MAEYSIVECAKALNYNSVQAIYNQSKELENLGYLKTNDSGKKVITEEGLQYLKIKRAANYRNAELNENNIEEKLMISESEIENKFLKEQNKYLKEQVDYFKNKYEEMEKDNKLWKEMYMQRDEIILEKERSMLLPVVPKKKKFWRG